MSPQEIQAAANDQVLKMIEGIDPTTAALDRGFLVVGNLVAMPLSGVSWSFDRSDDLPIRDELGSILGTLCFVSTRPPLEVRELTEWQYVAYLADVDLGTVGNDTHVFARDYAIIDHVELERYISHYMQSSALWGGYSHGVLPSAQNGWRCDVQARPGLIVPTTYHATSLLLATRALGPREQYLKLYHTVELLFDYLTFRRLVKTGDDLVGFGKVMSAYQKSEFDKLRVIITEFCSDVNAIAECLLLLPPFLDRAELMFQAHSKEGNPFAKDDKWPRFCAVLEAGSMDIGSLKKNLLATSDKARDELIVRAAAYFIYRIRSSIAHNRIGEHILTDDDEEFVGRFGVGLLEEVAMQIFSSPTLRALVA